MATAANGTAYVWNMWVDSTTNTSTSSGDVWQVWCNGTATVNTPTTIASAGTFRVAWNEVYRLLASNELTYPHKPAPETEEQKQARLVREEQARLAAEERKRKESEAKERAERLLISQLNAVQLQQLKEMDAFMVELQTRRYKVRRGQRVIELDKDGKQVAQYCIHPTDSVPPADVMLSQKLLLEHDEAAFLRIANRTPMVQ